MAERVFTEDEANALLPRIRALLDKLDDLGGGPSRGGAAGGRASVAGNGSASRAAEIARHHGAAEAAVKGLEQLGIVVRDLASGLIDFPAVRDGRPIFLCWRRGESRVAHWHDRTSGYSGRQPL